MEAKGKSGTVAGAILGMAAAVIFNVLTAVPPETQTVQASVPTEMTQTANPADPCQDQKLKLPTLQSHQASKPARSAS